MMTWLRLREVMATVMRSAQPRTPNEARLLVQRLNEQEARDRQQRQREHQARRRSVDEMARTARSGARGRGLVIDVQAVYAERNRPEGESEPKTATASPAPTRPRTLAQLAAQTYGTPAADRDGVIPATRRGGR